MPAGCPLEKSHVAQELLEVIELATEPARNAKDNGQLSRPKWRRGATAMARRPYVRRRIALSNTKERLETLQLLANGLLGKLVSGVRKGKNDHPIPANYAGVEQVHNPQKSPYPKRNCDSNYFAGQNSTSGAQKGCEVPHERIHFKCPKVECRQRGQQV